MLALAFAMAETNVVNYLHFFLIFAGALAAHASVNMLNEYHDFKSGLDFHTRRTPFSGGSGTLPASPELAGAVLTVGLLCLLLTAVFGGYFLLVSGWALLPVGFAGMLLVYFYTNRITRWPLICLIAPGLAFGPIMISGAFFVLSGHYSVAVLAASLVVFCLVNNLLLLNQFPDLEADRKVGRCHLPVLIGRKRSALVYIGFLLAAYAVLLFCVYLAYLPVYSLWGLLSLMLAVPAAWITFQYANDMQRLKLALLLNVILTLITPLLLATGLIWQEF